MKRRFLSVLLMVLLAALLPVAALATGGDGSGGGSDVGLALAESSVPDGSTNVAVDTSIVLTFNKNVVNMTVKDNNMGCFTLTSDSGASSISVIMGDDQVDPTIKRIITIQPNNPLSPDTKYKLTISKDLMSKSGSTLSQDVVISFATAGAPVPSLQAVSPGPAAAPTGPVTTPELSPSPAAPSAPPSPSSVPSAAPEEGQTNPTPSASAKPPAEPTVPQSTTPSVEPAPDATATVPTPSPDSTPPSEITEDVGDSEGTPVSPFVYLGGSAAVIVIGGTVWAIIRKKK